MTKIIDGGCADAEDHDSRLEGTDLKPHGAMSNGATYRRTSFFWESAFSLVRSPKKFVDDLIRRSVLVERYGQYERAVGLTYHQPMPRSAMSRVFFVYQYQRIGIEGAVAVALTADVNQGAAKLAL